MTKLVQAGRRGFWWRRLFRSLRWDPYLCLPVIGLCIVSLLVLHSAKQDSLLLQKHGMRIVLAFGLSLTMAQVSPQRWKQLAYPFYALSLILLGLVLGMGHVSKGSQRWLDVVLFKFQPSELMKLALPLMLARYWEDKPLPVAWRDLRWPMVWIGLPFSLVVLQPDLGTALLILAAGFWSLFFAGLSFRIMSVALLIALSAAPIFWSWLHDYQKERILTLFDPGRDPMGSGYHIIQSKIAIGSGGLLGKGWMQSTQSHLEYLPESATDFVFAVFSEEFGWVGGLFLLVIYGTLLWRGLSVGTEAQDTFSRSLASTLTATLFIYVAVNLGMVAGLLPVVGVPLPWISYGGTSLVTVTMSLGFVMSIQAHRRLLG